MASLALTFCVHPYSWVNETKDEILELTEGNSRAKALFVYHCPARFDNEQDKNAKRGRKGKIKRGRLEKVKKHIVTIVVVMKRLMKLGEK